MIVSTRNHILVEPACEKQIMARAFHSQMVQMCSMRPVYRLAAFGALSRSVFNEVSKRGPGKALLRLKSEAHSKQSASKGVETSRFQNLLSKHKSTPPETLVSRSLLRISGTSTSGAHEAKPSSEALLLKRKESFPLDDSQDPFAFDEGELDLGSDKAIKKRGRKLGKVEEASDTAKASGRREPSDGQDPAGLRKVAEEYREPNPHLAECLLSGVKVRMLANYQCYMSFGEDCTT